MNGTRMNGTSKLVTPLIMGILGAAAFAPCAAAGTPVPLGPAPYLEFDDSPFANVDFSAGYFYLEDFEDGLLNTPGLTAEGGYVIGPSPWRDSVDADDGAVDGSGLNGHNWAREPGTEVDFMFSTSPLPTHVGVVWTDEAEGPQPVIFTAYNGAGSLVATVGPVVLGDELKTGQTAEDRFLGAVVPEGVSRIRVSMPTGTSWELDHVQYGHPMIVASVDEPTDPSTATILGPLTPNPSTADVAFSVHVPNDGSVVAQVFDTQGRLVATAFDGQLKQGRHQLAWAPEGDVTGGVYFVRVAALGRLETRRLVLVR